VIVFAGTSTELVQHKPLAHQCATLWNAYNDDIMKDEFSITTAKHLGIRVAEAALRSFQNSKARTSIFSALKDCLK
jgi:hypothetical protein